MYTLAPLPYEMTALEPIMSRETLEFHYGKHHQSYVDNLNKLVAETEKEPKSLKQLMFETQAGPIFNNVAQIINHNFFWKELQGVDRQAMAPFAKTLEKIEMKRGSFESFQAEFEAMALKNFGSGWTWLVKKLDGELEIVNTSNAGNPMLENKVPLLVVDVWEHAYYVDYRNRRAEYLKNFWKLVKWEFVEEMMGKTVQTWEA